MLAFREGAAAEGSDNLGHAGHSARDEQTECKMQFGCQFHALSSKCVFGEGRERDAVMPVPL